MKEYFIANPMGVTLALIGLMTMVAAVCNCEWFFTHYRARLFVRWFGREGARRVYFMIGAAMVALGFFMRELMQAS